jgi:hypothetical protein
MFATNKTKIPHMLQIVKQNEIESMHLCGTQKF